jgi:hypothetical protein
VSEQLEDIAEYILCSVLPGESQRGFSLETLGLAVAGMPSIHWATLRYRVLGDDTAWAVLYPELVRIVRTSPVKLAQDRAPVLARLVLAEEKSPHLVAAIPIAVLCEGLLGLSRATYYRAIREAHLSLRAQVDSWARAGINRIMARLRG